MHGTELCSQIRRTAYLSAPRCLLSKAADRRFQGRLRAPLTGADISQRPFALPKRLPVSEPPFRGQRSRPTPSMPCRSLALPVRLPAPPRAPVRPGTREITAKNPLPDSRSALPTVSRISTPLQGLSNPSGSKRSIRFPVWKLTFRIAPVCPSLPGFGSILLVPLPDHRSRLAKRPVACCSSDLLEPLSS